MIDISTEFGGLHLRSPFVAASAPPTESAAFIARCVAAGIGAIVTKSIVDYKRENLLNIPRRVLRHANGHWSIQGSFASETLTVEEGVSLLRSIDGKIDVPVIASVGVMDGSIDGTVETCGRLVEHGASMVHLDLFYATQPRATDRALERLSALLNRLAASCSVPIAVKLNLDYPAHLMGEFLKSTPVKAVFLLDSVRVPPPGSVEGKEGIPNLIGPVECSLFGSWQKPLTLQYTRVLADALSVPICAGGGLQNALDALEALALGACTVQFATPIMVHGSEWIRHTTNALREQLQLRGYASLDQLRRDMSLQRKAKAAEHVLPVKAVIDSEVCIDCGVCNRLMFCQSIGRDDEGRANIASDCYGCGFCEPLCPTRPKAIRLVGVGPGGVETAARGFVNMKGTR